MQALTIDTRTTGRWTVVEVTGELDVATAPLLHEAFAALDEQTSYHLVVDMSRLEFMDSTGLEEFLQQRQRVRAAGGELVLAAVQRQVRKVFELTGVAGSFRFADSVEQVIGA